MKHSIKKIFGNLNVYLLFILSLSILSALLTLEHTLSVKKMDNLNNQKTALFQLTKLKTSNMEMAQLQFDAQSNRLLNDINELSNIYKYNFTQRYVLANERAYREDLATLRKLTKEFNKKADDYYAKKKKTDKVGLGESLMASNNHINSMIFKEISYNKTIFSIIEKLVALSFLVIVSLTFLYRKQLKLIYKDIRLLYSIEKGNKPTDVFSEEIDAISMRMNRRPTPTDNPNMLDSVTSIMNYKGMVNAYSLQKKTKEKIVTTVTTFEIDNFSKNDKAYDKQTIQNILKKVAYTISLHGTPVDIIARSAYNQFTLILLRDTKEIAYKEMEEIQENVSEMKVKLEEKGLTKITLSGGFMVKPPNMTFEESINIAKTTLEHAKKGDGNKLSKEKDVK